MRGLPVLSSELWTTTQALKFIGLDVGHRMTIVPLPSQKLGLISPIEL